MFRMKFLVSDFSQNEAWDLVWLRCSIFKMSLKSMKNKSGPGCFHFLLIITFPGDGVWTNKAASMKDVYVLCSKTELKERRETVDML